MKKKTSMMMLLTKYIIPKIILLVLIGIIVQIIAFYIVLRRDYQPFDMLIDDAFIPLIFPIILLIAIFIIVRVYQKNLDTYGFKLLGLLEKEEFITKFIFNIMLAILIFCMEVITVFLLSEIYIYYTPEQYLTSQSIFLAMLSNSFLYSLVPVNGIGIIASEMIIIIGMSSLLSVGFNHSGCLARKEKWIIFFSDLLAILGVFLLVQQSAVGYSRFTGAVIGMIVYTFLDVNFQHILDRTAKENQEGEKK